MKKLDKRKLTREQAVEIYNDLQIQMSAILKGQAPAKVMKQVKGTNQNNNPKGIATNLFKSEPQSLSSSRTYPDMGVKKAVAFVLLCAAVKCGVTIFDYMELYEAAPAHAVMVQAQPQKISPIGSFSQDEVKVLTALDARRVELEEKSKRLDERESDFNKRDKEYVVKLAELRGLTDKLKLERDKDDKKKTIQLDQLANVYGSMAPQESAQLIEQLDITIALPLLQRMPEKRMGQILPLMSPERALAITKLLSGSRN